MNNEKSKMSDKDIDEFVSLCETKNYHKQAIFALGCMISTHEASDIFGGEVEALEYATKIVEESRTEEEALAKCSSNGNREQRMVIRKPMIRLVGDDKIPVVQKFEERYTEDDLILDYLNEEVNEEVDDTNTESTESSGDSMDWLNNL